MADMELIQNDISRFSLPPFPSFSRLQKRNLEGAEAKEELPQTQNIPIFEGANKSAIIYF